MKCGRCRREFDASKPRCPACGAPNDATAGVFQTSIVRISAGGSDRVYRSLSDVPARLRMRLHKSTNSGNSATILIADRRGRRELARASQASRDAGRPGRARAAAGGQTRSARFALRLCKSVLPVILALLAVLALLLALHVV
jgi:hypothetical protein